MPRLYEDPEPLICPKCKMPMEEWIDAGRRMWRCLDCEIARPREPPRFKLDFGDKED